MDDVNGCWLPLNSITQHLGYLNSIGENQRICCSAKVENPLTYKISKVNNTKPIGIIKITLDQDNFNQFTDYVEKDKNGNIIGMWADYYLGNVPPKDNYEPELEDIPLCTISSANQKLRVGGSYKTLTANVSKDGVDVTEQYSITKDNWAVFIEDKDITSSDLITLLEQKDNTIKIKFANDRSYISKIITVRCTVEKSVGEIQLTLIG